MSDHRVISEQLHTSPDFCKFLIVSSALYPKAYYKSTDAKFVIYIILAILYSDQLMVGFIPSS